MTKEVSLDNPWIEPFWYMVQLHDGYDFELPLHQGAEITCLDQAPEDVITPFELMSWESCADKNSNLDLEDATVQDLLAISFPTTKTS